MLISSFPLTNAFARIDGTNPDESTDKYFGTFSISSLKQKFTKSFSQNDMQMKLPSVMNTSNEVITLDGISFENIQGAIRTDMGKIMNNPIVNQLGAFLTVPFKFNGAKIINDSYTITVIVYNLDSEGGCNCKNLIDFVKWSYKNGPYAASTYVNDNETTVGNNHPAWQMEISKESNKNKQLIVWTINDNIGSVLTYSYDDFGNHDYGKNLPDFRKMLKSIKFIPPSVPAPPPKQPSFLTPDLMNSSSLGSTAQTELEIQNNLQVVNSEPHPAILNSAIYKSVASQSHIFGEIVNNFSYPISVVKVYAAIRNSSGDIIATADGFTKEEYLNPGQSTGFWILVQNDVPEHSNYSLASTFDKLSINKPQKLKIDLSLISVNPITVVGTVTNMGMEKATFVHVNAIFYDNSHVVVDSEDRAINIYSGLESGQKGTFEIGPIMNYEYQDKIKTVKLSAESTEYINMPFNLLKAVISKK